MTATQQAFLELFREYVKPGGAEEKLDSFIDNLSLDDLRDCMSTYFDEDRYQQQRSRSLAIFLRMALRAVGKDVHYALRVDAGLHSARSPWHAHFKELKRPEKTRLEGAIAREKRSLPRKQREFADLFASCMTDHKVTQQKIQKFTEDLSPEDLQGCLRIYIEVSEVYPKGADSESRMIFFGLSVLSLRVAGFVFAHNYEANVKREGTVWRARFAALYPGLQKKLEEEIESAKVLHSDIKVKDKIYKNVPIGKGRVEEPETDKPHAVEEDLPAVTDEQKEFVRAYRRYVDSKGERKYMDAFHKFLLGRKFESLRGFVLVYLQDSAQHYGETASHESLQIFVGVVSAALAKGPGYYALKVKFLIGDKGIWTKRFLALDKVQYGDPLMARIDAEIREKARLIDEVKSAYFVKHRKDPDRDALRRFDPVAAPAQVELLDKTLVDCEVAVGARSVEAFEKAFGAFSDALRAQNDLLTLVLLVKRCRERTALIARYRHLLYLYGVGLLFIQVLNRYPEKYKRGFSDEERDWLLEGSETSDRYYADFAAQIEYAVWKRSAPDTFASMARGGGILQIYSDRLRLTLTPLIEAAALRGAVEEAFKKKPKEVAALSISIFSPLTGAAKLRVGQTIGQFFVLWWDEKRGTVYLQVKGLDQVVFQTDQGRLAEIYEDDSFYGEVARNTEHLLELIPFFIQILSFLPDLVSGGLTGLLKSIVFSYAFEKSMDALGIDPNKAQLFMLGAMLLAHAVRPKQTVGEIMREREWNAPDVLATGTEHRWLDAPATESIGHDALPSSATGTAMEARLADTSEAMIGRAGTDVPVPPVREVHVTDTPAAPPLDPHAREPALIAREGTDMRGVHLDDGRVAVGVREDAAQAVDVARAPTAEHKARPGPAHGEERQLVSNISDADRGARGGRDEALASRANSSKANRNRTSAAKDEPDVSKGAPKKKQERPAREEADKSGARESDKGRRTLADAGKPSAPPPPPPPPPPVAPPPSVPDRLPGTWTRDGRLQINEGGYELRGPNVKQARGHGPTYERAFNEQVAPKMAEHLSEKAVRIDERTQTRGGYKTPSSSATNRFKFQKPRRGGGIKRVPDATMEVVERIGGQEVVTEANLLEATINPDFVTVVGERGHKQQQITGTTWISQGNPRKGYTPDTNVNYLIIAPARPLPPTVAFLNDLMVRFPRLEVFWLVVR